MPFTLKVRREIEAGLRTPDGTLKVPVTQPPTPPAEKKTTTEPPPEPSEPKKAKESKTENVNVTIDTSLMDNVRLEMGKTHVSKSGVIARRLSLTEFKVSN